MKKLLLLGCLMGAVPLWAQTQTELSSLEAQTEDSSLVISFELKSDKDTLLFQQLLIIFKVESGKSFPVCLISDTVQLEKNKKALYSYPFQKHQILDTTLAEIINNLGRFPDGDLVAFSSLVSQKELHVNRKELSDNQDKCRRFTDDDTKKAGLHFSTGAAFASDSLIIKLRPTRGGTISGSTEFTVGGADTLWLNSLPFGKTEPAEFYYYTIENKGYRLCRSQNIIGGDIPSFEDASRPDYSLLVLKPPVETSETSQFVKKLYQIPFLKGTVSSESRFQSFRTPYSLQNPNYSRLYLDAQVNALGIPLKVTSLVTTEHNAQRKLNFFQMQFDRQAWISQQNTRKQFLEAYILNEKAQLDSRERQLINDLFAQTERIKALNFQDSLLSVKSKIASLPDTLVLPDSLGIPDFSANIRDTLKFTPPQISDSLQNNIDTSEFSKGRKVFADSLSKMQAQLKRLQFALEQVRDGREKVANLESRLEQLKKWKAPLSALEGFQVGQFYPFYSDYTISGTEVKGGQVELQHEKFKLSLFHGKSVVPQTTFIDSLIAPQEFTRESSGLQFSYNQKEGRKYHFRALRFEDRKNMELIGSQGHIRNFVFSLQPEISLHKTLKLVSEINWSTLNYLSLPDSFEKPVVLDPNLLNSSALLSELEWEPKKHELAMSLKAKRIGAQYYTAGNPFLRTNYSEYTIKIKKKFLNKKINASINYSYNKNNLDGSEGFTTKLSGYGIQVQSAFQKAPNFLISYQPYESASTYRPTSFFGPENLLPNLFSQTVKTSVLLMNANWLKQVGKEKLQGNISHTMSSVQLNQQNSRLSNTTVILQGKHEEKIEYNVSYSQNMLFSEKSVISVQKSSLVQVLLSAQNIKYGGGFEYANRGPQLYFFGQNLFARLNIWGVRVEVQSTIGWINEHFYTSVPRKTINAQLHVGYNF